MNQDRNFDDLAKKFAKNIYGSDKGDIRQVIVWEDINTILNEYQHSDQTLHVLDAGGGLAQVSQRLAQLGHRITLCDISHEMLQIAEETIKQNNVSEQYEFIHSSIQNLKHQFNQKVDLILFHAVMEWLVDPRAVLEELMTFLKPGGMISIMFYNQHGLVYKNVVCGNLPHVLNGMPHRKRFKLQPHKGLYPEEVYRWIIENHGVIQGKSGIRCFSDYIGDREYIGDYTLEDLVTLEKQLCRQEPYLSLGRYIHVWAQKKEK
ncbi:tRNA uridine 5-oxyacetic acid(34) methyltransferase CmoM [Vibrio sp.]|nr:tRNA uridine 5-oxyacetic acid(34) methyltransferase CmoM [Vibrio sp.]